MSFDRRTVDQHLGGRTSCAGESMEEVCPDPLGSPSDKAVVERLARPIFGRRVDPSAARFQDMHDAADHPPVIDTRLAARVPGQIRLKPRKLRIREPETVSAHHQILHGLMNHNMLRRPIILWVRALGRKLRTRSQGVSPENTVGRPHRRCEFVQLAILPPLQ